MDEKNFQFCKKLTLFLKSSFFQLFDIFIPEFQDSMHLLVFYEKLKYFILIEHIAINLITKYLFQKNFVEMKLYYR